MVIDDAVGAGVDAAIGAEADATETGHWADWLCTAEGSDSAVSGVCSPSSATGGALPLAGLEFWFWFWLWFRFGGAREAKA